MDRASAPAEADAQPSASMPALAGWMLFDFAHQPFYTLIQTFLFAPYFATAVVGDPDKGQALWGYAAAAAGVIVALGSPILGAIADTGMRRKPWVLAFGAIFVAGLATLWIATPKLSGLPFLLVLVAYAAAFAAAEFAAVFSNAIMPTLAPKSQLGRLSGLGWGLGYAGGLVSLMLVAGCIVTDPSTGKTLVGTAPILTLDAASRESDRLVGPLSAVWYLIFILPFFLFVPDSKSVAHTQSGLGSTIGGALARLRETVADMLRNHRSVLFLLLSRVLYSDGLAAIFVFGGIYGTAVFEWRTFDLGLFGIILSFAGALGAVAGGWLDDRLGAKTVIMASLLILLVGVLGILSVDRSHVLFVIDVMPKAAGSAPFSSAGEKVYLAFAILIGLVAAPVQAASRSLLARLAPADKVTQYFGLFAFSGKATAFLAPLMIAIVTQATGSMRWGVGIIAVFLIAGLVLMVPVREDGRG